MNTLSTRLAALSLALLGGCASVIFAGAPLPPEDAGSRANALQDADNEADVPPPFAGSAPATALRACWLACSR